MSQATPLREMLFVCDRDCLRAVDSLLARSQPKYLRMGDRLSWRVSRRGITNGGIENEGNCVVSSVGYDVSFVVRQRAAGVRGADDGHPSMRHTGAVDPPHFSTASGFLHDRNPTLS